jgi:hypothetical protein
MSDDDCHVIQQTADFVGMRFVFLPRTQCYNQ